MRISQDDDLWYEEGDCLVYLYTESTTDRGPCFKIPWSLIKAAQCMPLLSHSSAPHASAPPTSSAESSLATEAAPSPTTIEIHLSTPKGLSGREILRYHITTRNFFAWACGKPLVGNSLGQALVDLLHRMKTYRGQHVENVEDVLIYADDMGYSYVECCPDHALAMLYFAESHKLPLVWTDAFAHCVGMSDELSTSPEFGHLSCVTRALVTRASLEMDMHITKASRSLTDFLHDDLSSANLGLATNARAHLDNFHSFLLSFHVDKYGYWPPSEDATFPKRIFLSMHEDFQQLYSHMADHTSDYSQAQTPVTGGMCLLQNLDAFNERNNYPRLPFSLPTFPRPTPSARTSTTRSLRQFALQRSSQRSSFGLQGSFDAPALENRYSVADRRSLSNSLVHRYKQFEARVGLLNDGITAIEACKVRWILVYCILQTVRSVLSTAEGVRESDAPYPLCVLTTGLPPWKADSPKHSHENSPDGLASRTEVEWSDSAVLLAPDEDAVDGMRPLPERPLAARRNSSSHSLSKLATAGVTLTRSMSNLISAGRQTMSRSRDSRGSRGSRGSLASIRSEATVTMSPTELMRPPSLPRGLFELGEVNESSAILDDTVEIDQLVPPPGADEEVVAQALARIGEVNPLTGRPSLPGLKTTFELAGADTPPEERSPTLEDSHLAFAADDFESALYDGAQYSPVRFEAVDLDPKGQYDPSRFKALDEEPDAVDTAAPVTEAHEAVPAYESSLYDTLHLDSAPVGSLAYESGDEPPSLNWSQDTPESLEIRESREFDNVSLPSLDPATPSPGLNRTMSLALGRRNSSSLFSSLRSSRSFSIYKFSDLRVGRRKSTSRLSQTAAYTNEAPLSEKEDTAEQQTQIARQFSGRGQQAKDRGVSTSWVANF